MGLTSCVSLNPEASEVISKQQNQEAIEYRIQSEVVYEGDYLLSLPQGYAESEDNTWPLIFFLHGIGERGDDPWLVAKHGPPKIVGDKPNFPFIVVSPQCPEGQWWSSDSLITLLDEIEQTYRVDKERVYLTGLSMGGFGAWELGLRYPWRFAAMAPICGGGSPFPIHGFGEGKARAVRSLPVWAFHGKKDNVVPLSESQRMVDALKEFGCKEVKLTVYPEAGHDAWTQTYDNPALYDWFLEHRRTNTFKYQRALEQRRRNPIATAFPGDKGIEKAPEVLFHEDFEGASLQSLDKKWDNISNSEGSVITFSKNVSRETSGRRSLKMTSTLGENTGGHLYKVLPEEVDCVFARFYVRFPENPGYIHHFVHLGGYRPATTYPQGGAGERPRGDERFTVGIEPFGEHGEFAAPGVWNFYAYWPEMKISADGRYWGNGLGPAQPAVVPRGKWQCVEVMLKCNSSPNTRDGELALWLDGKLAMHIHKGSPRTKWTGMGFDLTDADGEPFEGFLWRKDSDLKINFFWLLFYVTENAGLQNDVKNQATHNQVRFDDIVIATSYIGPIAHE
ncbi:MAG: prolyl oligopeptidase family serine peptidase [Verrucomicrobia bacterium]|nr:prolyl oligopeptidase family serine peptidase [Verrucomicrobiota bacterium]